MDITSIFPAGHKLELIGKMAVSLVSPPSILLVDDNPDLTGLFSQYLRKAGHAVATAGDGLEGLEIFLQNPGSIRLLVSDIDMPRMSGTELARIVAREGCLVLLITGLAFPPKELDPTWNFLAKPFTPRVLLETIEQILARSSGPTQPGVAVRASDSG